jgi:hypothetical protein
LQFPQGGGCIESAAFSGWSRVLRVDAGGGSPHADFAIEGSGMISCSDPGWRPVMLAEVILDLVGEAGD